MATILIVDDEQEVTNSIEFLLGSTPGYRIHAFNDPILALEFVHEIQLDLVISDLKMPTMDGVSFLRKVRETHRFTPLILLTGYAEKEDTISAVNEAQIWYYIEKPFEPENLKLVVRNALEQVKLHNELKKKVHALESSNRKLRATQKELLERDRLSTIGKITSQIVHDLKNPMSSIHGYVGLIRRLLLDNRMDKKNDMIDFCSTITKEIDRLVDMVQGILDYSKDDLILSKESLHLSDVIHQAISSIVFNFKQHHISIKTEMKSTRKVSMDYSKMIRAIFNILYNAKEAMPNGGTIWIRCWDDETFAYLEIEDSGVGMPAEIMTRIFEPFFTYGKSSGTGLGMAIVKKVIENHSGTISVASEENKGTCFRITFPTDGAPTDGSNNGIH